MSLDRSTDLDDACMDRRRPNKRRHDAKGKTMVLPVKKRDIVDIMRICDTLELNSPRAVSRTPRQRSTFIQC